MGFVKPFLYFKSSLLFNHFTVYFTVAAAVKTPIKPQHFCLGVAGTSLFLWGCLCHAAADARATCPSHPRAVAEDIHPLRGSERTLTEVFNLWHTVPNRLCCSFKPLNTWHELFYRNSLKNLLHLNPSEACTHAMQEGSCYLKQSDSPMWTLILVFLSQAFDMLPLA